MVDDVNIITETAESKVSEEALDRARLARERREAEQRKRLEELRAHAAAAQAQREKRDEDRRRRQAEQRARDEDRRVQVDQKRRGRSPPPWIDQIHSTVETKLHKLDAQADAVEERKRAIWEASVSRREALLQREKDRTERLERARAARSAPRPAFAFGSSTPRLLEPLDSTGFFWAARSTNPIDQMSFFESLAASTSNVMFASAPLTRRASALQLDSSDTDNKDDQERQPQPVMWSSVARRRTDLVPTLPAPRPEPRSGETTPSRPGSALSNATGTGVVRRAATTPRRPRPASIAGTGVNTPRGEPQTQSAVSTPSVSRDGSVVASAPPPAPATVPRRPTSAPRRPRPASLHAPSMPLSLVPPADGKPPVHRKPKSAKDPNKTPRGKSLSASPGRTLSPSPAASKESSVDKDINKAKPVTAPDRNQVNAVEVTQKLEALQIHNGHENGVAGQEYGQAKINENKENFDMKQQIVVEQNVVENKPEDQLLDIQKLVDSKLEEKSAEGHIAPKLVEEMEVDVQKPIEKKEPKVEDKVEDKKETSIEKTEDIDMSASMTARRITTEEEAKAALAERRRRAREELERQAELERQRLQREAEEEAERQRVEEERQRREEEEARELAAFQRRTEEEKLRKAIEAQQQLEREEAERKAREEVERQARLKEDEEKRRAAEETEKLRKEEAEREEKERLARKQRVEAIMARTRLKKQAEEDKKVQDNKTQPEQSQAVLVAPLEPVAAPAPAPAVVTDNGNVSTGDLLGLATSQLEETKSAQETYSTNATADLSTGSNPVPNNGNVTADLLGLSEQNNTQDITHEQVINNKQTDNLTTLEPNNGNMQNPISNIGHVSANFIQTEIMSSENQTKMADVPKLLEDDFTTHNGHGALSHPLTLQNAI